MDPPPWSGPRRTIVVVSSAAAAHKTLAKNDATLASRLVPDTVRAMSYDATSTVFLPSSNPLWKQDRVIMGTRFSSGRGLDTILFLCSVIPTMSGISPST
ncbi:hypothetical protein ZWY2020_046290 [Hordeum vulgare]|nr:hypothetical protein ZWY2020_046290 [Hordeum vulgare]